MKLEGNSVETTLGNPQEEKKNKQKTWSKPYTQIAPFIAYHDMEDRGNLEEGTKRLFGKDTSRSKREEIQIERKWKSKIEPFANEMGRTRY